jgi:hypothetical protein
MWHIINLKLCYKESLIFLFNPYNKIQPHVLCDSITIVPLILLRHINRLRYLFCFFLKLNKITHSIQYIPYIKKKVSSKWIVIFFLKKKKETEKYKRLRKKVFFYRENIFSFNCASSSCRAEGTMRQAFKLLTCVTEQWCYSTTENFEYLAGRTYLKSRTSKLKSPPPE